MRNDLIRRVRRGFSERFGRNPRASAYAPGRVEILGNHTDYNEGVVLSAAINFGVAVAAAPAAGARATVAALDLGEEASFNLPVRAPLDLPLWAKYLAGVAAKLDQHGARMAAFDLAFSGNVPMGAGLSSSAALEVSAALALSALSGFECDRIELAKICQAAENEYTGARCGLLDQFSSLFGIENGLVYSDFRALSVSPVPIGAGACFIVADTHVKHSLVASEYNERRARCEEAAAALGRLLDHPVKALRDVSPEELARHSRSLDPVAARRALHVVGENARVFQACDLLGRGDLAAFGRLMYESHESSVRNFENSCPELDFIVGMARARPDALGARLSGGGFGGSAVILTAPDNARAVGAAVAEGFYGRYGKPCDIRVIRPSECAGLIP